MVLKLDLKVGSDQKMTPIDFEVIWSKDKHLLFQYKVNSFLHFKKVTVYYTRLNKAF